MHTLRMEKFAALRMYENVVIYCLKDVIVSTRNDRLFIVSPMALATT